MSGILAGTWIFQKFIVSKIAANFLKLVENIIVFSASNRDITKNGVEKKKLEQVL